MNNRSNIQYPRGSSIVPKNHHKNPFVKIRTSKIRIQITLYEIYLFLYGKNKSKAGKRARNKNQISVNSPF
jgi:hypothetical protein